MKKKKKGGKVELPNGDAEKGIPQHIPKKMANQELSKESELKEGKNEKKRKRDLTRWWEQDVLCLQKGKTGEPTVTREDQKLHYKRKGWVVKKAAEKKKETQERRNSPGKTIRKSVQKEKY